MNSKIIRSFIVLMLIVLTAATVLMLASCNADEQKDNDEITENASGEGEQVTATEIGEGAKVFPFTAVMSDGSEIRYNVHTDETIVGAALVALELISGDQGDYGLYVKEVCGERAVYEENGHYWAFYVDGEYAMSGVDMTEITEGATYSFKYE